MQLMLVDDHQLLCVALSEHLQRIAADICNIPISVTCSFSLEDAIKTIETSRPDMVFLDLDLEGGTRGSETLRKFQENNPDNIPVVLFTGLSFRESDAIETLRVCFNELRANGLLRKSADLENCFTGLGRLLAKEFWVPQEVFMALASNPPPAETRAADGHLGLSPRQWTVAKGIMKGLQNKEIVYEINKTENINITELYIRQIATQIYKKLGVRSRTQAAMVISAALDGRHVHALSPGG